MIIKTESPPKDAPDHVETKIGPLYVFSLSAGDQMELQDFFDHERKEIVPEDSIRELIKYVCFPEKVLGEKKSKPDSICLADKDIERLADCDLENIAKCFLDRNQNLYRERITETSTNEEGKTVHTFKSGKIIHPKEESDSWIEYLYDLIHMDFIKYKEMFDSALSSDFSSVFSKGLESNIAHTLSLGNSLSKKMAEIQNPFKGSLDVMKRMSDSVSKFNVPSIHLPEIQKEFSPPPYIDLSETIRMQEENRERPFNKLGDKLDKLIDINIDSGKFIVETNKTQIQAARAIKESGDTTSKHSKINIGLTIGVIVLTVLSLGISAFSSYLDYRKTENEQTGLLEAYTLFSKNINELTQSIDSSFSESKAAQENYKLLIENQKKELDSLTDQYNRQKETIESLQAQLLEIQKVSKE